MTEYDFTQEIRIKKGLRKFRELSREYPITQLISFGFSESSGLLRGSVYGHVFRWGYFGKGIHIGKKPGILFKNNKYLQNSVDIRDYCKFEGKGKVIIGENSGVGDFGLIRSTNIVKIGNNVLIGPRVFISDADHSFSDSEVPIFEQPIKEGQIEIGDDVFIGANVTILQDVTIGKGSIIGAGTVVTKTIPEYSIVVGNPGRVIKKRQARSSPEENVTIEPSTSVRSQNKM